MMDGAREIKKHANDEEEPYELCETDSWIGKSEGQPTKIVDRGKRQSR
jgi:hypothetical protein